MYFVHSYYVESKENQLFQLTLNMEQKIFVLLSLLKKLLHVNFTQKKVERGAKNLQKL